MIEQQLNVYKSRSSPYQGWVQGDDFITPTNLMAAIGVSGGLAFSGDANPGWLKFFVDGKTLYIAKKPMRVNLLYETLNAAGAVKGTKVITIAGKQYKVRLMTGATTDPGATAGGEYDNIFSRATTLYGGGAGDRWANLSAADVGWVSGTNNGQLTLCQEANSANGGWLTRGYPGSTVDGTRSLIALTVVTAGVLCWNSYRILRSLT